MPNMTVTINSRRPFGPIRRSQEGLRYVLNHLIANMSNARQSDLITYKYNDAVAVGSESVAGGAVGALVGSSLSGAVGGTFLSSATLVTVTASGGDVATMNALSAAIRANTAVNRVITAVNRVAQVTLASVTAGQQISIFNTTFTAVTNAAAITQFGQFNIDGADSADAAALALAINRHPSCARIRAVSNGAIVYVGLIEDRAPTALERITILGNATTFTAGAPIPVQSAICLIIALDPGPVGNDIRAALSGTGMTFATNGVAGNLGNGMGGATPAFRMVIAP